MGFFGIKMQLYHHDHLAYCTTFMQQGCMHHDSQTDCGLSILVWGNVRQAGCQYRGEFQCTTPVHCRSSPNSGASQDNALGQSPPPPQGPQSAAHVHGKNPVLLVYPV